jgi:hypothetical protein
MQVVTASKACLAGTRFLSLWPRVSLLLLVQYQAMSAQGDPADHPNRREAPEERDFIGLNRETGHLSFETGASKFCRTWPLCRTTARSCPATLGHTL